MKKYLNFNFKLKENLQLQLCENVQSKYILTHTILYLLTKIMLLCINLQSFALSS